ncbi:hypothetical protein EVAR_47738_1 [Eumeta japonica]|uniref:Uncharacterized protein n=1 Tax=Eumeta variegata TaxID=151549 RepID=A0A4C1VWY3_EUMVA|nr:hypothetical protein EVAR_47738_1 [Eumeta japonica]
MDTRRNLIGPQNRPPSRPGSAITEARAEAGVCSSAFSKYVPVSDAWKSFAALNSRFYGIRSEHQLPLFDPLVALKIRGAADKSAAQGTLAMTHYFTTITTNCDTSSGSSNLSNIEHRAVIKYFVKETPKEILKTWYQFFKNLRLRIRWSKNGLAYFNKDERAVKMILAQGVL